MYVHHFEQLQPGFGCTYIPMREMLYILVSRMSEHLLSIFYSLI